VTGAVKGAVLTHFRKSTTSEEISSTGLGVFQISSSDS
jgi:hypothetical protein